jgi:anti-anti-sigma factor
VRHSPGVCVVKFSGHLQEFNKRALRGFIDQQLAQRPSLLVLEMARVRSVGSDGVDLLLWLAERTAVADIGLALVTDGTAVRSVLVSAGLAQVFSIHPSVQAAVAELF